MELKERIIEATIEEFNEKGLKFTMDQLARRVGISKKTLYLEFEDKETLFLEAVEKCFNEIKKSEKVIFEDPYMDIMEKIKRIIIVLPERYQTLNFSQLYGLEEKYPHIYKKIESKIETDWENTIVLLEEAIKKGRIRNVNIQVLKTMISSTIESFIRSNVLEENKIAYTDALEEMMDMIMNGICL